MYWFSLTMYSDTIKREFTYLSWWRTLRIITPEIFQGVVTHAIASGPKIVCVCVYMCVLQFRATGMKAWWDVSIFHGRLFELSSHWDAQRWIAILYRSKIGSKYCGKIWLTAYIAFPFILGKKKKFSIKLCMSKEKEKTNKPGSIFMSRSKHRERNI